MPLMLSACNVGSTDVHGAKGETPARYVVCGVSESNCFVAARFKDLETCQSHKEWEDMLCDRRSTPGVIVCKKNTGTNTASAFCTL